MSRNHHIDSMLRETGKLDAKGLLAWAAVRFAGRVALASSLGAEDQVLTDMLATVVPPIDIFTLDTGRLPQETHETIEATGRRYGRRIEVLVPDRDALEAMVCERGTNLFRRDVASRKLCCLVRKVQPLRRRLAGLDAWICGLRREQSVTRAGIERVEWDDGNGLVKINPLVDWTEPQVWDYIRAHGVPYNRLHDRGYPSIGCEPCTRAIEPGEDIRAGRWWWESPVHRECGLHRLPVTSA
jgi:phosphoadenosine phosphosulfate reductase